MTTLISVDPIIEQPFFEAVALMHSVLGSQRHRLFGRRFVGRKKLKQAILLFNECLEVQGDNWQVHFLLGKIFQTREEHKIALSHFFKAYNYSTDQAYINNEIALSAIYCGENEVADEYSLEGVGIDTFCIESFQYRALILLILEKDAESKKCLEIAYHLDERNVITIKISEIMSAFFDGQTYRPDVFDVFGALPFLIPVIHVDDQWTMHEKFPPDVFNSRWTRMDSLLRFN
jgi:tetratricopeptide (TPR) repeat protein